MHLKTIFHGTVSNKWFSIISIEILESKLRCKVHKAHVLKANREPKMILCFFRQRLTLRCLVHNCHKELLSTQELVFIQSWYEVKYNINTIKLVCVCLKTLKSPWPIYSKFWHHMQTISKIILPIIRFYQFYFITTLSKVQLFIC